MEERKPDRLDRLEYKLFRLVVFIISVYLMYELLNKHTHIAERITGLLLRK
jgi:hypothetical protein